MLTVGEFVPDKQQHHKATGYSGGFFPAKIKVEVYDAYGEDGIRIVVEGGQGAENIILPLSFARDLPNLKRCIAAAEHEWLWQQGVGR